MSDEFDDLYGSKYFGIPDLKGGQPRLKIGKVDVAELREKDGSTKLSGASAGSSSPVTYTTEATRTAMTAAPAALAPSTARVEWCQGCDGSFPLSSSSTSVTATDIRPGTCGNAGSAELGDHVGGEQLQVVQVGHVQ